MNDLKKLFELARGEAPPSPPAGFDTWVMRRLDERPGPEAPSLVEQLDRLFPKLAIAAAILIGLCIVGDYLLETPGLTEGIAQVSAQWIIPGGGI